MQRYLQLFLALSLLSGCGFFWGGEPDLVKRIEPSDISRVILVLSEKMKWEKGLTLEDSVVYYDHYVNRIRLDFSTMDNVYLWGAREMLVDLVEELLARLNTTPSITAQLRAPPLTANDLEVYITHKSFYNKYIDMQRVGLATLRNGIAYYVASDGLDCDTPCWHRRSEYYYQSREFVMYKRIGERAYSPEFMPFQSIFGDQRFIDVGPDEDRVPLWLYRHSNVAPLQTETYTPDEYPRE